MNLKYTLEIEGFGPNGFVRRVFAPDGKEVVLWKFASEVGIPNCAKAGDKFEVKGRFDAHIEIGGYEIFTIDQLVEVSPTGWASATA